MKIKLPIVAVGYNRPNSLKRLLNSLGSAYYGNNSDIELVISIDYSGSGDSLKVAEAFDWKFGTKRIIAHKENLGLRKHVISCGDIALENDGVIVLEDDCVVSKDFYNYALQTFNFYKTAKEIAGISLYSYNINENALMPFYPLQDGYDVYFLQVPSSLGQIWTNKQWAGFKNYIENCAPLDSETDKLPLNVINWPESSWKKYYYKYLVENDLYFVYPHVSHSTNFGDAGTHYPMKTTLFQVPLAASINNNYKLLLINDSLNVYDGYFEILPVCLKKQGFNIVERFTVDLYGTKQEHVKTEPYILTIQDSDKAIQGFGMEMKPLVNNVIYNNAGNKIALVLKSDQANNSSYRSLISFHYPIFYDVGYKDGLEEIKNSKTYKLGEKIKKALKVFWFKKQSKS